MTLGNRIGRYRRQLGMTQEALAQKLEVTNQAVSKWESGACCPDITLLPKLADLFGITMDELFGREAPVKEEPIPLPEPEIVEEPVVEAAEEEPEPAEEPFEPFKPFKPFEPVQEEPWKKSKSLFEQLFRTTMEKVNQAVEKAEQGIKNADFTVEATGGREIPIPEEVELDWEDDQTLRVALFIGKKLIVGHPARKRIEFCYEGPALNIHSECSVSCNDVQGNVSAGGDISCDGVCGNASAGGDISCDCVNGNVHAIGDVSCDGVLGHVQAGGDVSCDAVQGNVTAGGDVDCESVAGSIKAGGDVNIG